MARAKPRGPKRAAGGSCAGSDPGPAHDEPDDDAELNRSLRDVMDLMAHETERLKVLLDYVRLTDRPNKEERIRLLVQEIDRRQDRLDELQALIVASHPEE